jgi:hypothetical protein
MLTTHRSFRPSVLALGVMALLLVCGTATKVRAQSAISDQTASERTCPAWSYANCSLKGIYGFGYVALVSHDPNADNIAQYNTFATGGMWKFHGDGTFDASDTQFANGAATPRQYSGTYSINPDGTGTADFTAGGLSHTRNLVIVNEGKTIEFIQTDAILVGTMIKQ